MNGRTPEPPASGPPNAPKPQGAPNVPGWDILSRIGAGGMGTVWKARRADGALAALKVADGTISSGAQAAGALFRRESLACLNLDHPNLVRGLDVGTTSEGQAFLAMEFVDGPTLGRAVRDGGPLAESLVRQIATALAKALDHAHRLGLVHGDVKPSNVLLGRDGVVRLADLGLVSEAAVRAAGPVFATRAYAAPEVLGGGAATVRSDLFSLGATLAEALLGRPGAAESQGWADATLPAASPSSASPGAAIPDGLRAVVERLLRADPSRRYASAAELILDLDALAAGDRPLGAILGASAAAIPRTAAARRRTALVAAVIVGVAAVVAVVLSVGGDDRSSMTPMPPTPRSPDGGETPPAVATTTAVDDPHVVALRFLMERSPDDFVGARALLDEAETAGLDAASADAIARLRESLEQRAAVAATEAAADRTTRATAARDAGDVAAARAILLDWPANLAGAPQSAVLAKQASAWIAAAARDSRSLADEAESAADASAEHAPALLDRIDAALRRSPFDGDERARLEAARPKLAAAVAAVQSSVAERQAREAVASKWRTRLAAAAASRDGAVVVKLLRDAYSIPPDLEDAAARVVAAYDAADGRLTAGCAVPRRRAWAGPVGERFVVAALAEAPSPEAVFLSPLWQPGDGRDDAIAAAAGGRREAAAWLLAHGAWAAAASMDADVTALVRGVDPLPVGPVARPLTAVEAATRSLAFRDGSEAATAPSNLEPCGDPVVDAWASAVAGLPPAKQTVAQSRAAAAAKSRGLDAFLSDDAPVAWTHLAEAAALGPRDAEVAVLRARVLLSAARALPTAPALVLAFAEARRAADLDPKLAAARELVADTGIALCDAPAPELARAARPITAAACEDAARLVREEPRWLAFAARRHLGEGRADRAAPLLRRAVAKAPGDGRLLLDLARAEIGAGRKERARDALRRATDAFGGAFPEGLAEIAADVAQRAGE